MALKFCSKANCGNTLATPSGTYTFHDQLLDKNDAEKLCKSDGGILATMNTREELDAVHKFTYECDRSCESLLL